MQVTLFYPQLMKTKERQRFPHLSVFAVSQGRPVDLINDVTRGDKHVDMSLAARHQVQDEDTSA